MFVNAVVRRPRERSIEVGIKHVKIKQIANGPPRVISFTRVVYLKKLFTKVSYQGNFVH